jgi:hypothetical protein
MRNVIAAYKKHGILYVTRFEWGGFIWRPLGYEEAVLYEGLFNTVPKAKAELEDEIFRECVIDHPLPNEEFDNWKAGIVTTVAQLILFFSTVKNPKELLQRLQAARQDLQNDLFSQLFMKIVTAFPGYTVEKLRSLPVESFLEKVAMLEALTGEELKLEEEKQKPKIPYFPGAGHGIDFAAENKKLEEFEMAPPKGDWNLNRRRSS